MVGNIHNLKLQKDMIKKQIESMDGIIHAQSKKELELVMTKNEALVRDYNRVKYRRLVLEKQFAKLIVSQFFIKFSQSHNKLYFNNLLKLQKKEN